MPQQRPLISLIAAMAKNRVIGCNNKLPWHLPADLQHFKKQTLGKPMIMGRKTWESLPGLLPQRRHIVITQNCHYVAEGCDIAYSAHDALMTAGNVPEIMVVGGAMIYQEMLPLADRLILTLVHTEVEGDAFFPEIDDGKWLLTEQVDHQSDEKNPYSYSFLRYERRRSS